MTPFALGDMVRWMKNRYDNFPVWVTENGYAGDEHEGTKDQKRIGYYSVSRFQLEVVCIF